MKLFKRVVLVVLALASIGVFCRGQGYEWTLGPEFADKKYKADMSCFRRYDEATQYERVLRCQADADKLVRDKFKWW